ncbi:MAG: Alpha-galactosidase [Phycisphaerae bacterium]|nr:Alpha-galactosidase [Phycisphaerae bacterium]
MKKGPKVVVVGAGSMFFGRQALWQMLHSEVLRTGTLTLVDTDESRLKRLLALGRLLIDHLDSPLTLEGSVDRRDVLEGADFVVLSFADRGVHFRGVDVAVSAKHGVRMCSGDTIGPGGIFRTLRELPEILNVARDVERLCPSAWVINYINPTAANGIGLMRHAPNLKSFALCDGLHMPHVKRRYLARAGVVAEAKDATPQMEADFDLRITGVNHFTWLLGATYKGRDVLDDIRASVAAEAAKETDTGHAKARYNQSYALALWDIFGCYPACIAHTKEYVPYWQGHTTGRDRLPALSLFDAAERQLKHDAMWEEIDAFIAGRKPLDDFVANFGPDHATDIIESMWSGAGKRFYVNTANRGAVGDLPDDAFLEMLCDLDMGGPRPLPCGRFPDGLRSLQQQVLDTHELTVEAAVTCDRGVLRRAMLTDPIVNSVADADAIIDELLLAERDALPEAWTEGVAVA